MDKALQDSLLKTLREAGVVEVTVTYDGRDDESLWEVPEYVYSPGMKASGMPTKGITGQLRKLFRDMAPPGFESGYGGSGFFKWNTQADSLTHFYAERVMTEIHYRCDGWKGAPLECPAANDAAAAPTITPNMIEWLANGRRGLSSNFLFAHLTGIRTENDEHWQGPHWPSDPADLRRCRLLLEQCPELVARFPEMASACPEWAAFVKHWDVLCFTMDRETPNWRSGEGKASETYDMMQSVLDEVRAQRHAQRQTA